MGLRRVDRFYLPWWFGNQPTKWPLEKQTLFSSLVQASAFAGLKPSRTLIHQKWISTLTNLVSDALDTSNPWNAGQAAKAILDKVNQLNLHGGVQITTGVITWANSKVKTRIELQLYQVYNASLTNTLTKMLSQSTSVTTAQTSISALHAFT